MIETKTKGGIFLGSRHGFQVDILRLGRVTNRITLGLYYRETGNRVPADWYATSMSDDEFDRQPADVQIEIAKTVKVALQQPKKVIGDNVFSYQYVLAADKPLCSVWVFTFYGKLSFMTLTLPKHAGPILADPREKWPPDRPF